MLITSIPYFMTNEEWYYHDVEEWCYKLTPNAPKEAIISYNAFYNKEDENILRKIDNLINGKG